MSDEEPDAEYQQLDTGVLIQALEDYIFELFLDDYLLTREDIIFQIKLVATSFDDNGVIMSFEDYRKLIVNCACRNDEKLVFDLCTRGMVDIVMGEDAMPSIVLTDKGREIFKDANPLEP